MGKYAYCTTVANKEYLMGAVGLYYSLQKANAKYPFLFILADRIKEECKNQIEQIRRLPNVDIHFYPAFDDHNIVNLNRFIVSDDFEDMNGKWALYTTEKLAVFTVTNYEKLFFLDADILVLDNFDKEIEENKTPMLQILWDKKDYRGYFISSYLFMINPDSYDINNLEKDIIQYIKDGYPYRDKKDIEWQENSPFKRWIISSDECLWPFIFPPTRYDEYVDINQLDFGAKLYHKITCGEVDNGKAKYWMYHNLNTIDKVCNYVYNTTIKNKVFVQFGTEYNDIIFKDGEFIDADEQEATK